MSNIENIRNDFVKEITDAVAKYTDSMLSLIRTATLEELTSKSSPLSSIVSSTASTARPSGVSSPPTTRPERKSNPPASSKPHSSPLTEKRYAEIIKHALWVLSRNPKGIITHELRNSLALDQREFAKIMEIALATGLVKKEGVNRGTMYFRNLRRTVNPTVPAENVSPTIDHAVSETKSTESTETQGKTVAA